jgi:hypothetical protein
LHFYGGSWASTIADAANLAFFDVDIYFTFVVKFNGFIGAYGLANITSAA